MHVLPALLVAAVVGFAGGVRVGWRLALGRARSHASWLDRSSR